ncbi:MAG: hypothetical protein ACRD8O_08615, partial [Bryobacteraceae bacterium]
MVAPDENSIRRALASGSRRIRLPAGIVPVSSEIPIPSQTTIEGAGPSTILRAAPGFRGRALLVVHDAAGVRLRDLAVDGNRGVHSPRTGLPPDDVPFRRFTVNNGVLADVVTDLRISGVQFRNLDGFA